MKLVVLVAMVACHAGNWFFKKIGGMRKTVKSPISSQYDR
jgi:hypothetical protein